MFILIDFIKQMKMNRDLIFHLVLSDLKSKTSRTYLGLLWWVADPILYMLIFYVLVHMILDRGGPNYPAFLFVGLIPLKWTISCLVDSVTSISSKNRIIQQIYVPKVIFVVVRLLVNTVKFIISMFVLMIFLWLYGIPVTVMFMYMPLIVIVHGFLLLTCMIYLAHLGVYVKDTKNVIQYATRVLLYLSPILYSIESVPQTLVGWIYVNPVTTLIISYRNIFLYQSDVQWGGLAVLSILSLIAFYLGLMLLARYDKQYAKVI